MLVRSIFILGENRVGRKPWLVESIDSGQGCSTMFGQAFLLNETSRFIIIIIIIIFFFLISIIYITTKIHRRYYYYLLIFFIIIIW